MKFIFLLFVLITIDVYSQEEIDKKAFLFGTLSDYMGRQKCNGINDSNVDRYAFYEKSLINFNYQLLKDVYPDMEIDSVDSILKSKKLANEINDKFIFTFNEGFCSSKFDDESLDSLFVGKLDSKTFKTKLEKISYLLGAYMRHGNKKNNQFYILIANSESTFPVCVKYLKQLKCKEIKTEVSLDYIPASFYVSFKPTKELEFLINKYSWLRTNILNEYEKFINSKK